MAKRRGRWGFNFRERAGNVIVPVEDGEGGGETAFYVLYADVELEQRLDTFTESGEVSPIAAEDWSFIFTTRLVGDRDGVIHVFDWFAFLEMPVRRYDSEGNITWSWQPPSEEPLYDAAVDGEGTAYIPIAEEGNLATRVYRITSDGTASLFFTLTHADESLGEGEVQSAAVSADGTMLYLMFFPSLQLTPTTILGVRVSDQQVMWTTTTSAGCDSATPGRTLRRHPSTDTLFALDIEDDSGISQVVITRLDFESGIESAPTVTWHEMVTAHSSNLRIDGGLAVNSTGVYAGHHASDPGGGGDWFIITALDHDGDPLWRLSGANFQSDDSEVIDYGLAATEDYVLASIWDETRFPNEGIGLVLLDAETGAEVEAGVFPLEVFSGGAMAAVAAGGGAADLTTFDGLPLTTWDGEQLSTWET